MYGASCTICPDGAELVKAFEMVKPGEYDAILMDIQMPHMNGYEATKAIRGGRNPLGKTIPIIAMTANAFSDDIQNSIAAGMDVCEKHSQTDNLALIRTKTERESRWLSRSVFIFTALISICSCGSPARRGTRDALGNKGPCRRRSCSRICSRSNRSFCG